MNEHKLEAVPASAPPLSVITGTYDSKYYKSVAGFSGRSTLFSKPHRKSQTIVHEVYGSRTPAIKMMLIVFPTGGTLTEIGGKNEVEQVIKALSTVYVIKHVQKCSISSYFLLTG
ncbi:hypothetical protein EVAR_54435_1 [Eumeta japonica]|uniref:Uncharacterized protein n=1 Tax=Eumeta variegata TaxID=151549 RepID=A0A4C1YZB8_EUMVA|nr:hypothetical protein EVAR_54435_1 [Eumeta japonica]